MMGVYEELASWESALKQPLSNEEPYDQPEIEREERSADQAEVKPGPVFSVGGGHNFLIRGMAVGFVALELAWVGALGYGAYLILH